MLFRSFRRTDGNAALAEDITQQVFTTFARSAPALRRHTLLTGWLYVATRHAAMVNGIDELAVTNLDGLDTLDRIKVCTGYKVGAVKFDHMPADIEVLALCEAVYEERKGWKTDTSGARKWKDLPPAARDYLKFIADQTGAKLTIASVGPGREQTIFV